MSGSIAKNANRVLGFLAQRKTGTSFDGPAIADGTGLSPDEINDAVSLLVTNGYAEWEQYYMTDPFAFGDVAMTARGRYEYERSQREPATPNRVRGGVNVELPSGRRSPVGSPFGFEPEDWETVDHRTSQSNTLFVVFGHQFESKHYISDDLQKNVKAMFERALNYYNSTPNAIKSQLEFRVLRAGYGEHLFNQIARDIISADIAVFDTSDLNPNVMLEFGVALTWGVLVLPVRKEGCPVPPTDVSGQTWAIYRDSGAEYPDSEHRNNLGRIVAKGIRKKLRR